ncbi:PREDICTED: filament-like plant protein 7 isoform X2 [Populus euphratica]|uniref:Filament-like plant protein 7 isoform X2 n=1 Tax=Populus euphratica TaxID=75702 RepID=A0AAJ6V9I1_POPEU|nr:PREDICTED: filament-like plant protein 7 isoform X2 [Populus euphratica]
MHFKCCNVMSEVMDHKTWLWRKKSADKIVVATDHKVDLSSNEEEIQTLLADKAELENHLKILSGKLASALSECNAKDDLAKKQAKLAKEAMTDQAEAEAKAVSLKQELDKALQQRAAGEQRSTHLEAALKECMQQLRFVREDQEQRIHDAVMKTSNEFEKSQMILEEELAETSKTLAKIGLENTHLSKALLAKEKLIEDLSKQKAQVEADFNALMSRLESTEKDSASLKYEVRVLEKELEIRNKETEFNRRTADVSHKQHLESVKRIAKLEEECQRLRVLVRKRLPGPAALAKMRSEVEILERDSVEMSRRRLNGRPMGLVGDSGVENSADSPRKRINFLTEQLCVVEEENKTLKEAFNKKANELQFSRAMYARTASKLSQVESHLDELLKGQTTLDRTRSVVMPHELSLASTSEIGSDNKVSSAESWASALISELEHFKQGKQRGSPTNRTKGASDISMMDDFAEMEKLVVSVDEQFEGPCVSSENVNEIGREIIPVSESGSTVSNQVINSRDKASGWLHDILKVVLEQNRVTLRKPDEILEDVRIALANINHASPAEYDDTRQSSTHSDGLNSFHVGGYTSWKPIYLVADSPGRITEADALSTDKSSQPDLSKSLCKIIELIEGITLSFADYENSETLTRKDGSFLPYENTETHSGYIVRVLQWKTSELIAVLQQFAHACYDLLDGKSDLNMFSQELCSALDWTMNHCFSIQDKKHFDWDESRRGCEAEFLASNGHHSYFEKDECHQSTITDENRKLREDLINIDSEKRDLEARLQSATNNSESLMNQLKESEKIIGGLQTDLETLRGLKARFESQNENHKLKKEDVDTQLTVARAELNEAHQKLSSMEMELENKRSCCEELEATCLELQLQLESMKKKDLYQEESQLRTGLEITAASEKLAECQETILNLGKQLKAMASPSEAALFDKAISTSTDTNTTAVTTSTSKALPSPKNKNQRSSLLDQMLNEDSAEVRDTQSINRKESDSNSSPTVISTKVIEPLEKIPDLNEIKHQDDDAAINYLAIVPSKKSGGANLWRKLLWRKKKSSIKIPSFPFAP